MTLAAIGERIVVIQSKIEDLHLEPQSVDVLISEPMGTLLVNERMLETYLYARDHFLKQGGRMFPVRCCTTYLDQGCAKLGSNEISESSALIVALLTIAFFTSVL